MVGLCISSVVNVVFGCWAVTAVNGRYPDHAFYAMAVLVMFLLPLLATFLGLALLERLEKVFSDAYFAPCRRIIEVKAQRFQYVARRH